MNTAVTASAPPVGSAASRLASLDALRGIAVTLVIWLHVTDHFSRWRIVEPDATLFLADWAHSVEFGRLGVILFFAISGFIIPQSLRGPRGIGVKRFLVRRFWRLFPLYWLSIPFGVMTSWWFYSKSISLSDVLLNTTMLPRLLDYQMVLGLYWTLELELAFYFLLALLFCIKLHNKMPVVFLISYLLIYLRAKVTEPQLALYFSIDVNSAATILEYAQFLAVMFWGTVCRLVWDKWQQGGIKLIPDKNTRLKAGSWSFHIALLSLVWLTDFLLDRPLDVLRVGLAESNTAYIQYAAPLIIAVALFSFWLGWGRFAPRPLVQLGEISFALYLFHPVVLYTVDLLLCQPVTGAECRSGYDLSLASYLVICFALVVALSMVLHRWVEKPCIEIGRRLTR